jgi:hypothetical protein
MMGRFEILTQGQIDAIGVLLVLPGLVTCIVLTMCL